MIAGGGTPAGDEVELGRCRYCGAWARGRWIEDLTAHTSIVEHCPEPEREPTEADADGCEA
ncbi:hypothetical protein ACIRD3_32255 [Kitasatospora sp. NPDC093550]|uniref:hypothetical protein n=1 Tax=Kitasatospora sp. NPDC093550 TaxID=3364089 RepID=UPI003812D8E6